VQYLRSKGLEVCSHGHFLYLHFLFSACTIPPGPLVPCPWHPLGAASSCRLNIEIFIICLYYSYKNILPLDPVTEHLRACAVSRPDPPSTALSEPVPQCCISWMSTTCYCTKMTYHSWQVPRYSKSAEFISSGCLGTPDNVQAEFMGMKLHWPLVAWLP
jgi:hypothetical protein